MYLCLSKGRLHVVEEVTPTNMVRSGPIPTSTRDTNVNLLPLKQQVNTKRKTHLVPVVGVFVP